MNKTLNYCHCSCRIFSPAALLCACGPFAPLSALPGPGARQPMAGPPKQPVAAVPPSPSWATKPAREPPRCRSPLDSNPTAVRPFRRTKNRRSPALPQTLTITLFPFLLSIERRRPARPAEKGGEVLRRRRPTRWRAPSPLRERAAVERLGRRAAAPMSIPHGGGRVPASRHYWVLIRAAMAGGSPSSKTLVSPSRLFALLGLGFSVFDSRAMFFSLILSIRRRILLSHLDLHTRSALVPMLEFGITRSRSMG